MPQDEINTLKAQIAVLFTLQMQAITIMVWAAARTSPVSGGI